MTIQRIVLIITALTVGFAILKVVGVLGLSWWWIFAPVVTAAAVYIIVFLVCSALILFGKVPNTEI